MNKRFVRYFNQMAVLSRIVMNGFKKDDDSIVNILEDTNNERYTRLLYEVPEIIQENRCVREVVLGDLTDHFFEKIEKIIEEGDIYIYFLLLRYMDRAIGRCFSELINFMDDVEEIERLNTNEAETRVLVFKKTKCYWEYRSIKKNLNAHFCYFYLTDSEKISEISIHNYLLDENLIMKHGKKTLNIGISPLLKDKVVEFSAPYPRINEESGMVRYYFRVEEVQEEERLANVILQKILLAGERDIDILVFPEMLGTELIRERIIQQIREEKWKKIPPLIIFPSIWKKTENDGHNTNKSCMLLMGKEVIFEQDKRKRFHYEKEGHEVYEDIAREKNNVVNILHVEGIGRIIIVICYDYLQEENRKMIMENLCPTLVCSPSFSTGSFPFAILKGEFFSRSCNWVWCNTCSARNETPEVKRDRNFETIGIITKFSKNCDMQKPLEDSYTGVTKCQQENCASCIYETKIPLRVTKEAIREVVE